MAGDEPVNLREWQALATDGGGGRLFTCGRPGRGTFGRERRPVDDDTIDRWTKGLPNAEVLDIVSLLGSKRDGYSEFSYYPFRSSRETVDKPTLQQWLDGRYHRRLVVHEFPTVDARGIPSTVRRKIIERVRELTRRNHTVVIIDSAGAQRTAQICGAMGYEPVGGGLPPNKRVQPTARRARHD